ncbi:MAG: serine hydrolase, partial [Lachnospiraceae bacterium]|nr:serine hydrolase [Lachnospiraceae bacterium]
LFTLFLNNVQADNEDNPPVSWPTYPDIYAEAGVLIEASTGTVLYDKNCHQQMYPASITKILTTLIALEEGNLSDMVEFSHYAVYSLEVGDAHISRQEGELLSLKDCLYAVMLASANEVANAVGEYVAKNTQAYTDRIADLQASGTAFDESKVAIEVFADMMNERAAKAGALGTHFCNPNGLFNENHYTTCYDMAMITRDASKNDEFLKIESNITYVIPTTNKATETHPIRNRHQMVFPLNSVYYEGILGGKTGYVDQSGTTLVTFAKRNGMTLISVVMKSNGANVYNDTKLLLDYGFNNFSLSNISETETKFSFNKSGNYSNLNTVFDTNSSLLELDTAGNIVLPNGVSINQCKSELTFYDGTQQTGTNSIAKINYYYNDINVGGTDLILNNRNDNSFNFGPAKEPPAASDKKEDKYININIWFLIGLIIIILIVIAIIYYTKKIQSSGRSNRRRRRHRSSGRNPYR